VIKPGGSFVVRFTPPRAGTFMYHTPLNDEAQISSGLYVPLIVVEPGKMSRVRRKGLEGSIFLNGAYCRPCTGEQVGGID
jgi:FtsP/CotA-like multicopper oxidase with cupredoxin domain